MQEISPHDINSFKIASCDDEYSKKMDREKLSDILDEIGNLLELKGENPFKARAYYNAARLVREGDMKPGELLENGRLRSMPGIGEALSKKITELVRTGRLAYHERLKDSIPESMITIMKIPGIGPRRAYTVCQKLGIENVDDLESACRDGRILSFRGFDENIVQSIIEYIERMRES
ncbi:helix-hairpin-helix domain-containing protein [Candidatus Latescibacterota bacterium]